MTYETLKTRWNKGRISEAMLRVYVRKGVLTKKEFEEITGIPYEQEE